MVTDAAGSLSTPPSTGAPESSSPPADHSFNNGSPANDGRSRISAQGGLDARTTLGEQGLRDFAAVDSGDPVQLAQAGGTVSDAGATKTAPQRVHVIAYADTSLSRSDVHTFKNAAANLKRDYERSYPGDKVVFEGFSNGDELARIINNQPKGSIVSLDIVSHGNAGGMHIAERLPAPVKAGSLEAEAHYRLRGGDQLNLIPESPQTRTDAEFQEEKAVGLYGDGLTARSVGWLYNQGIDDGDNGPKSQGAATLGDLDRTRFSKDGVFVELHGCKSALDLGPIDSFAEDFAEMLPAGSTVVGHTQNNWPNGHPGGLRDDYRHNEVIVFSSPEGLLSFGSATASKPGERYGMTFPNSSTPSGAK